MAITKIAASGEPLLSAENRLSLSEIPQRLEFHVWHTVVTWVIANKEWCVGVFGSVAAGTFAVLKWIWPLRKRRSSEIDKETGIVVNGSDAVAMRIEAPVTGGVIAGSHNVQTVVINQSPQPTRIPISDRKPSSPNGNDIKQREQDALKGIPLYLHSETRKRLFDSYLGVRVEWPVRLSGVYKTESKGAEQLLTVRARYGHETLGPVISCLVKEGEYPILKTLHDGHRAFIEGRIIAIDEILIELEVTSLEFE